MKKLIKKIAAYLCITAIVINSCVSILAEEETKALTVDDTTVFDIIEEGQVIYTIGSGMTQPDMWNPESINNIMKETEFPGVYSLDIKVPALTKEVTDKTTGETSIEETKLSEHRFSICAYDYYHAYGWNRIILGEPEITPEDVYRKGGYDLTKIKLVLTDKERDVTVYFDSKTYGITMTAKDGKPVDYTIGWITYDDSDKHYTPKELSEMSFDDFKAGISEDRQKTLERYNLTELPDFVKLESDLVAKLDGKSAVEKQLTSDDDITITYNTYDEAENLKLYTKKLTEADDEYKNIDFTGKIADVTIPSQNVKFTAYNINLLDKKNNPVRYSSPVTVKIPCPSGYDKTKCKIYRVENDGTFNNMKAEYKNGYIVFKTNNFGTYLITETKLLTKYETTVYDIIEEGQVIYTIGSGMTQPDIWNPVSLNNVMKKTEFPGVYSLDIKVPPLTRRVTEITGETNIVKTELHEHSFCICAYDYESDYDWNRTILGVPEVTPMCVNNSGDYMLTKSRLVLTDKERDVTVYFDSKTYGITMKAKDGKPVDYTIGWITFDDEETYYTPKELSEMSFDDFKAGLSAKRQNTVETYNLTELPDFVKLEADLIHKLADEKLISGDVNNDGEVDIKDSALIKRYLAGWEVEAEMNMEAADVDEDGGVTIKDSALIKRQLAGWE